MKKILVLCTGNSCRSQMLHGYLKKYAENQAETFSAGIETHGVNPIAIKVMGEDGIDISKHTSNAIEEYNHLDFDFVITVCDHAKENCPWFPSNAQKFHHNFKDPAKAKGNAEEVLAKFRSVRNEIRAYAKTFVNNHLG